MSRRASADPNLAVVAKKTGFSVSTVSRALRNAEGIHTDTRTLVLQAAEEVGYELPRDRVNINSRPHQVMALTQQCAPLTDQRYLSGMSRASVTLNLSIFSHHVGVEECAMVLDAKTQPPAMRTGMVDGLVLIHRWPPAIAAKLSEKWPTVSIVHHYAGGKIDHVGIDDRYGVMELMRHLYETGHRKIGFFGFCREMSWSCSRFAAYVEALVTLDIAFEQENVVAISLNDALSPAIFPTNGWSEQVDKRLKGGVTAWFCASAATGFTLCSYFSSKGIRMPDDVALTSYHGASVTAPANLPVITSTAVADEELGSSALRRLVHRFDYPEESQRSILIPAKFVQGETTRPVAPAQK